MLISRIHSFTRLFTLWRTSSLQITTKRSPTAKLTYTHKQNCTNNITVIASLSGEKKQQNSLKTSDMFNVIHTATYSMNFSTLFLLNIIWHILFNNIPLFVLTSLGSFRTLPFLTCFRDNADFVLQHATFSHPTSSLPKISPCSPGSKWMSYNEWRCWANCLRN